MGEESGLKGSEEEQIIETKLTVQLKGAINESSSDSCDSIQSRVVDNGWQQ
jgi:hypothetical protein